MRSPEEFFDHLKLVGFVPATIIDVGVANGTPDIYSSYPDSYYVLVDPVVEYEEKIRNILKKHKGEYHQVALSDKAGELEMYVQEPFYVSTLQFDKPALSGTNKVRTVPVKTLDDLFAASNYEAPIMLKTDCQGHDLNVIRGAIDSLENIEVIICELPVYGPWGGGFEFIDYIVGLDELGYRFYDIWGCLYRAGDARLQNMDLVFVKTDGQLRQNKLYPQGPANVGFFSKR